MHPRLPLGANEDTLKIVSPLTSSVNEITWGGNLKIMPLPGAHFGVTFYESLYDRVLDPQVIETITGGDGDNEPGLDLASDTNDYDEYSGEGMFNEYAGFGNEYSSMSPWNEYSSSDEVPVLVDRDGGFYGYFTINEYRYNAVNFAGEMNSWFDQYNGDIEQVRVRLCNYFGFSG